MHISSTEVTASGRIHVKRPYRKNEPLTPKSRLHMPRYSMQCRTNRSTSFRSLQRVHSGCGSMVQDRSLRDHIHVQTCSYINHTIHTVHLIILGLRWGEQYQCYIFILKCNLAIFLPQNSFRLAEWRTKE